MILFFILSLFDKQQFRLPYYSAGIFIIKVIPGQLAKYANGAMIPFVIKFLKKTSEIRVLILKRMKNA